MKLIDSTSCNIYFTNNPSRMFYSGQMLTGLVVLKLTKEKRVRGIFVKIIGRGYCRWRTGSGSRSRTNVGEECYLNEKTFLVGDENGDVVLSPSEYNYMFSCMLPPALPTSVEGKIGYIRYSVAVHIERPLWSDQRFQEYFTVFKMLNLNDEIMLRYPLVREDQKTYFICCLLRTGPLKITGSLPVGGYVPGQTIEFLLQIDNRSDQAFQNFVIHITKHIRYHTHENSSLTKYDKMIVKSATCNGCPNNQSRTYNLCITVPPLPPTDESTSNIVKVSYRLEVRGSACCFREDPSLIFPITIGTLPIQLNNTTPTQLPILSNQENYSTQPVGSLRPSPIAPFAPSTDANGDEDMDPPTYEEAISNYPDDGTEFRPSSPVFRRTPSCTSESSR